MLEILKIKNIAIIDSAEVHFQKGLNIISGETGAGKSILIEAISLLLGSRARMELIRSGCDEAVVEGLFCTDEMPWIHQRLEKSGFPSHCSELLIKRTVHKNGRHRISINGELATLSTLQNLCEGLIDLCGQHEHQSLLKPMTQLDLLDRFGNLTSQAKTLGTQLEEYRSLCLKKEELQRAHDERSKRSGFLKYQIGEIKEISPEPDEDLRLQNEKTLLQSAEGRAQIAEGTRNLLESEESGVLTSLQLAIQKLRSLHQLDPQAESFLQMLERSLLEAEEVALSLNRYLNTIELDPGRLEAVQDRLSLLGDLKRKYGTSITAIYETLEQLEKEFASLDLVEEQLEALCAQQHQAHQELLKMGNELSKARLKAAGQLAKAVTSELKDLKMGEAEFDIELQFKEAPEHWNTWGGDFSQFRVQTNPGEPARALGKIASGGELSRLMLAIRRVISDRGKIGVYLFDEIDSGIGGQTAFQVGRKLKHVSTYNQVICITHLPQVASFADHHLVVQKSIRGQRTLTVVNELSREEQKKELARMLGGPALTSKNLENASELLELAGIP